MRFAIACLVFALPVAAQIDSSTLRVKFGAPLNREIFHMPAGFDLTVDYGASQQVCKLEVPALMPTQAPGGLDPRRQMYAFLSELVPDSIRGKELGRMAQQMSLISLQSVDYENVSIGELSYGNDSFRDTITVRFKNAGCQ
jgi:hypothetical protein